MPRFTLIAAVHLFLLDENKVLLSRRFQTGYEDGNFSVPAGHVDGNETIHDAMIREAREEIGIEIASENLNFSHVMHRLGDRESVDFFFFCSTWQNTPINCEENKCDLIEWFPLDSLPLNTVEYVKEALSASLAKQPYSHFGWSK